MPRASAPLRIVERTAVLPRHPDAAAAARAALPALVRLLQKRHADAVGTPFLASVFPAARHSETTP